MNPNEIQELLENAAQAMGIYLNAWEWHFWKPLHDNNDCTVMCARLRIGTAWLKSSIVCRADDMALGVCEHFNEDTTESRLAAWRLAATKVAAEIGKEMK